MSALEGWDREVCDCGKAAVVRCDVRTSTTTVCKQPCCAEHAAAVDGFDDTHRCAAHQALWLGFKPLPATKTEGHPTT